MRKLWIVTELFPPDETSTSYILGEIANALTDKYEVNVICGPEVYDIRKKTITPHSVTIDSSIIVHRTKETSFDKNNIVDKLVSNIVMGYRLMKLARMIQPEDKVLMVTNPAIMVPMMAWKKKRKGFEMQILIHDVFPENTVPAGIRIPKCIFNFLKNVFDRSYSAADGLIVIGRDMKEVMELKTKRFQKKIQIKVVENWGDTESITPLPFPSGPIKLEYAGNIGRVQGLESVLDSLPSNVELHLFGTGALENKLKEKQIPNVFFHGAYSRAQQKEIIGMCDISLVTLQAGMYGLGVPSKTYNILAAGRPVLYLGPEDSEIYRLVKEEGIGYCEWPKFFDRDEMALMGARARQLAERRFSKQSILELFKQCV